MGPHCSPEKQNKREQIFDYICSLVKSYYYFPYEKGVVIHLNKFESLIQ